MNLNEHAVEWLEKYKKEIPSEEIIPELIKIKKSMDWISSDGIWPVPVFKESFLDFEEICEMNKFNELIGDPENWDKILKDKELYDCWVVPNAILLFSKPWFDRVKWKDSVRMGIPFPLFSRDERKFSIDSGTPIEQTSAGKAIIARIISKTSYALGVFLKGKWYEKDKSLKNPGGYIINSIKNDLVQRIGLDLGLKQYSVPVCPMCLSLSDKKNKSILTECGSGMFRCDRCSDRINNLNTNDSNEIDKISKFSNIIGITCVCPSKNCSGKFIPISFVEMNKEEFCNFIKTTPVRRSSNIFKKPPDWLVEKKVNCPYCNLTFLLKDAIKMKSGHKGKSGMLTGLPKTLVWEKIERNSLDKINEQDVGNTSFKEKLAGNHFNMDSDMVMRQKINLLIDDITVRMFRLNKKLISDVTTFFFYHAAIEWMKTYYKDAYKYFFEWNVSERDMSKLELLKYPGHTKKRVTEVVRGQEATIHNSFFQIWIKIIEDNIFEFEKINPKIKNLSDLKWFCQKPKFPCGPIVTFKSNVNYKKYIPNNVGGELKDKTRIVKVYSLKQIGNETNFTNEIKGCDWKNIQLKKDSFFEVGDEVEVVALLMPGHPTHAPIQRILRLRSQILYNFVLRIKEEEKTGEINSIFWSVWKKQVDKARKSFNIKRL